MKRPNEDDYYWYRPRAWPQGTDGHDLWQPVKVTGRFVEFIATVDPVDIDDLDGTFVKMGRPIPFMGTIGDGGLKLPSEGTFM